MGQSIDCLIFLRMAGLMMRLDDASVTTRNGPQLRRIRVGACHDTRVRSSRSPVVSSLMWVAVRIEGCRREAGDADRRGFQQARSPTRSAILLKAASG